jgi:hypothetical protein
MIEGRFVTAKSTLSIGQKVFTLQDPDEATFYHAFHGLAQTTSEADLPVITSKGVFFPWFQNWWKHSFPPGNRHGVLCPYVYTWTAETPACRWKAKEHMVVMDTIGAGRRVSWSFQWCRKFVRAEWIVVIFGYTWWEGYVCSFHTVFDGSKARATARDWWELWGDGTGYVVLRGKVGAAGRNVRNGCSIACFFQTTSERVDRERLKKNFCQEVRLASRIIRWVLERWRLNVMRFSYVGWAWKCQSALFRPRVASRHSYVHHGAGDRRGFMDDSEMWELAARRTALVTCSSIKSTNGNSWSSNVTDCENPPNQHVGWSSLDVWIVVGNVWLYVNLAGSVRCHVNLQELTTQDVVLAPDYRM